MLYIFIIVFNRKLDIWTTYTLWSKTENWLITPSRQSQTKVTKTVDTTEYTT